MVRFEARTPTVIPPQLTIVPGGTTKPYSTFARKMEFCMKRASVLLFAAAWAVGSAQMTAAAENFEDKLLATPTTPDVIAKGLETDGYQLAVSAYA
jgi:hypothetical protein